MIKKIKCPCGKEFQRNVSKKERPLGRADVLKKWKLRYCDLCYAHRVRAALSAIPNVIEMIITETK
jgi:hypothetical protein